MSLEAALQSHAPGIPEITFDNRAYLDAQLEAFGNRMSEMPDAALVVEFGGKPFGDHHASRVLPGYNPHNKAAIVRGLQERYNSKIAMVVNARDILYPPEGRTLNGRIRGDSGLRYDEETIRMINESKNVHGFNIESVVTAVVPREITEPNKGRMDIFADRLAQTTGIKLQYCYEVPEYPDAACLEGDRLEHAFSSNDVISDLNRNLILLSPGGGSGKFGVALSEILQETSCQ